MKAGVSFGSESGILFKIKKLFLLGDPPAVAV
jgi:hypothetical protein